VYEGSIISFGVSALLTWTTDEPATSRVDYGTSAGSLTSSQSDGALATSHTIPLTGLAANTTYYFRATSADAVGNTAVSPNPPAAPASFTMPSASLIDTTAADFAGGTTGINTAISQISGGEVILAGAVSEEFGGTALPSGWTATPWDSGGSGTVSGGALTIDGALVGTTATYGSGRSLEFVATFGGGLNQHVGFGVDFNNDSNWAMFSVKFDGTFNARTSGPATTDTPLSASLLGAPHRYRIEWNASNVVFLVDGGIVATHILSFGGTVMRPLASDLAVGGGSVVVDWLRMSPFPGSGTFDSRIFDAGQTVAWGSLSATETTPAGTAIALSVRTGNTAVPDGTWTSFTPVSNGGTVPGSSRYLQYRAALTTSDSASTPVLLDVAIGFSTAGDNTPPTITSRTPAPNATGVLPNANVTVQFSEPMDPATITTSTIRLRPQGAGADLAATVTYSGNTATLDPSANLLSSTVYQATVAGTTKDVSGNALGADVVWTFTTAAASLIDTTFADFAAGTPDANTRVSSIGDGEVILAATVNEEFGGTALPTGWSSQPWGGGGFASVAGGSLVVDGADAATDATYTPGRALEFVATFGSAHFQHVGFVNALAFDGDFAIFSTGTTTDTLLARSDGTSTVIPGSWLNAPHRYRIEWTASNVLFYADGNLVATHAVALPGPLRPLASDADPGGPALSVDWIRMTPYAAAGSFTSRVLDAGQKSNWGTFSWAQSAPSGTAIALLVRTGDTATPDGTWTPFTAIANGASAGAASRYLQYRADRARSGPAQTPERRSVSAEYAPIAAATITGFSPASGPIGTSVTINGTGFTGATGVQFNGTAATNVVVVSDTQITATVPSGATTGKIGVATPGGTATSATNFTVSSANAPTITSFTPAAGPISAHVTITGTKFTGTTSVKFNGKAASFTVDSSTQITATVSAGTTTGKITVTTPSGTATSATDFIVAVPPTVTGFTPGSGVPGASVVITGSSFDTASAVAFNAAGATFTVNSPTQITATVPSTATTGKIKVTNAAGAASSAASFLVPPQITSFSPASGRVGTSVVINGKTFNSASAVTFNGAAAAFSVNSSTKITATVPSGATTGKISVTTPGGTAGSATDFAVTP